jgi:hypothetical protein
VALAGPDHPSVVVPRLDYRQLWLLEQVAAALRQALLSRIEVLSSRRAG